MQYTNDDRKRFGLLPSSNLPSEKYRSEFRRDYARLIHSPAFRRLQGKTQLFPGKESDFFRNRMSHSLEVAQISKSIALKLNDDLSKKYKNKYYIDLDLAEFAGLAHDLGHPPFGHLGEQVLDELMCRYGGFEGNAQTLRILARIEKRHPEFGLNLTMRSLAAVLKYDRKIPLKRARGKISRPVKGFYSEDQELVNRLKNSVLQVPTKSEFKTIECKIMDIADDIAYSTYDLEDTLKAGFIGPMDIIFAEEDLRKRVRLEVNKSLKVKLTDADLIEITWRIFQNYVDLIELPKKGRFSPDFVRFISKVFAQTTFHASRVLAKDGYVRSDFTSYLIGKYIRSVNITVIDSKNPALSSVEPDQQERIEIEVLKRLIYESQINSTKLRTVCYRGRQIIETIFKALTSKEGQHLLPDDFGERYSRAQGIRNKKRVICDFICGMTDRYALEFYGRLLSENPQTIFKPF
ncbi:MAG: dNTP triphosphohydrolase [Candidatus Omnitrophica bacterium]|nr:dNTP triphosphohydrolase [Candidatus Omnitrophota bacterium]